MEAQEKIAVLWQASRLTLTGEYVTAPEILRVHGSPIGTLGNFVHLSERQRVRKRSMCRLS